jgi:hypothetical protein
MGLNITPSITKLMEDKCIDFEILSYTIHNLKKMTLLKVILILCYLWFLPRIIKL